MQFIGVDYSTDPKKTGLARASEGQSRLQCHEARTGRSPDDVVETLVRWLSDDPVCVIAIDAPLGWPKSMGDSLASHRAGQGIDVNGDLMFKRETDRTVQRTLNKRPLEVGANLIARTALAALKMVAQVRTQVPVEMGWTPGAVSGRQLIEVYPVATLVSRELPTSNYKGREDEQRRAEMLDGLGVQLSDSLAKAETETDHVLDAIICCVAADDYARGHALIPTDRALAVREGWIWFRPENLTTVHRAVADSFDS